MEAAIQDPKAARARKRRRIAMILMFIAGAGSLVLAIINGSQHHWTALVINILLIIGMTSGLYVQHQLGKKQRP